MDLSHVLKQHKQNQGGNQWTPVSASTELDLRYAYGCPSSDAQAALVLKLEDTKRRAEHFLHMSSMLV
jgi:hypothetical protein